MKILTFLTSKAGKVVLSAAQAVGLSAAVGVAGVAAWQMLSGGGEVNPDTVFSSYNDGEVVYVAGGAGSVAGAGGYAGYGAGGEVQSGIRTKLSKDIELMQRDAARMQISDEPQVIKQEQQISAYKMDGKSDGLGMGKNAANELGIGSDGDMSAFQARLADLQAAATAKQKEAEKAALAAEERGGDAAKAAAAALQAQGSGKWGMAGGMARAGGSNLNSSPLQAGGASAEGQTLGAASPRVRGTGQIPDRLGAAERAAQFEGGRDSIVRAGKNLNARDTLSSLQKQSVDIARNKNRSGNEGARAFMAGEKLSGGINIIGETVNTGVGSSSDFNDDAGTRMGNMHAAMDDLLDESLQYEEARKDLRKKLWAFIASAAALTLMSFLKFSPWTWAAWAIACAGLIAGYVFLQRAINRFEDKWKDKAYKGQYKKGGYHNKATAVAATALGLGLTAGIATFTAVIGTMLLINWNAPSYKEPQETSKTEERSEPASPYGPNVAEDALYLNENQLSTGEPQK